MSTPLFKKLGIKDGFVIKLVDVPKHYFNLFHEWPEEVVEHPEPEVLKDFIHVFTKDADELRELLPELKKEIKQNGMIWISWPKKAAKVECNVDGNEVRRILLEAGLVDVKVCSIDQVWSGQKAVIRVKDRK